LSDILNEIRDVKLTQQATADQTHAYLRDIAEQVLETPSAKTPAWTTQFGESEAITPAHQSLPPDRYQDLPDQLSHICLEIERSREFIQDLAQSIEESEKPHTIDVWERAVRFLARNSWWALARFGCAIDAPRVLPGPEGSMDLHWDYPEYELLVNIPSQQSAFAGFYGDDRGSLTIKGKVHPDSFNSGLVLFLTERQ
jgi:hypothetical protein